MILRFGRASKSAVGYFRGLTEPDQEHETIFVYGKTLAAANERAKRLIAAVGILSTEMIDEGRPQ